MATLAALSILISAIAHALLGDKERALALRQTATQVFGRDRSGRARDPDFESLREELRFRRMLARQEPKTSGLRRQPQRAQ